MKNKIKWNVLIQAYTLITNKITKSFNMVLLGEDAYWKVQPKYID